MKNAFKVFELNQEEDEAGELYGYLVPTSVKSLSGEFANETEILQTVADEKRKGEKFEGEFVVLNVKTF